MPTEFLLDEDLAIAVRELVRQWEGQGKRLDRAGRLPAAPSSHTAPILQAIEVTSATADADGYPARILTFDGSNWNRTYDEVRAVKIGGGTLNTGYAIGRLMRVADSGRHIYGILVELPAASGSQIANGKVFNLATENPENTWRDTGFTFTLPSPGTYLLTVDTAWQVRNSAINTGRIKVALFNGASIWLDSHRFCGEIFRFGSSATDYVCLNASISFLRAFTASELDLTLKVVDIETNPGTLTYFEMLSDLNFTGMGGTSASWLKILSGGGAASGLLSTALTSVAGGSVGDVLVIGSGSLLDSTATLDFGTW